MVPGVNLKTQKYADTAENGADTKENVDDIFVLLLLGQILPDDGSYAGCEQC